MPNPDPRVVLITGASSGIGHATALAFARQGARVIAFARRADRLDALAAEAADLPGAVLPVTGDVTQPADMQRAVEAGLAEWGQLDVLVANAGIGHRGALLDADWADLETVLRVNIDGVLHSVRATVPAIRLQAAGHVILVSSVTGPAPPPFAAIYGASKAFVNALGRALRSELRPDGIAVSVLLVGQTHTEFAESRLGNAGRVAGKLPTMSADFVAQRIVAAADSHQGGTYALRWLDRLLLLGNAIAPGVVDRLLYAIYQ